MKEINSNENNFVYEVVDASNENVYFPLGFFPTLESAINEINKCKEPNDFNTVHDYEGFFIVEVREHKIGTWIGSEWKTVFKREFVNKYNEIKDENFWAILT